MSSEYENVPSWYVSTEDMYNINCEEDFKAKGGKFVINGKEY